MFAQVGIGTTTPDGSSILELNSTDAGMLIPRMSQEQRDAITHQAFIILMVLYGRLSRAVIWIGQFTLMVLICSMQIQV